MTDHYSASSFPSPLDTDEITDAPIMDPDSPKVDVIKVSAKSRSTAVAGAIAAVMREHRYAEVQAIGDYIELEAAKASGANVVALADRA